MDPNRWKTVNQIFHAAVDVSPGERSAFVATASNGDSALQAEVEQLLQADSDAESYLESPLVPGGLISTFPHMVNPGDMLCDRFRIVRAVGEGGMGQVFEAFDSELTVPVALKVIRSEIASSAEALARFRQEVRLARRITHPNVCRTFDIERATRVLDRVAGTRIDVVFLTMEFLEGETLDARIKRAGPLQLDEALEIARQVADALKAAHALGVIHRDMKPANIILVPLDASSATGVRAVITDFGLARVDAVVSSGHSVGLGQTGRPMGTLAYMAPEQLENAPVSPPTDIYAFGLVLFEMVTGRRAFPTDNFLSGIAQRLTGPPPSPQELVPSLPASWCRAIEGCLRIRPEDRFQSAADVIVVLEGGRRNLPRTRKSRKRARAVWSIKQRLFAVAAVVVAAVALFLGGLRLYRSNAESKVEPGALVYLTQVKNQTGEKSFGNLTELIQAGLAQSAQINLLDQGRAGDILQQMTKAPDTLIDGPVGREIAMRAGAARVVFETVTGSAGNYSLNVDIQQPDATSPLRTRGDWTRNFPWQALGHANSSNTIPPQLLTAIRNASDWIRLEVGESANDIARLDTPPEDVTTDSWDALADYSMAEKLANERQRDEAVASLESAIEKDPHFATAQVLLGDILVDEDHVEQGFNAYENALGADTQNRLSLRERDRIKGIVAHDTDDFQAAETAFREYSLYYENDYLGWFFRARPLLMLGRTQESIAVLERAHQADPKQPGAVLQLVRGNLVLGDLPEAHRWIDLITKEYSSNYALYAEGPTQFVEGDYAAAARTFKQLEDSTAPDFRESGTSLQADLLAEQGRYREAIDVLNRLDAKVPLLALNHLELAELHCQLGENPSCVAEIDKAVSSDPSPFTLIYGANVLGRAIPTSSKPGAVQLLHCLEALEGKIEDRRSGVIYNVARHRLHGEILLAKGSFSAAIAEFRRAAAIDAPARPHEYLARSLAQAAARQPGKPAAIAMIREAESIYAAVALHPAVIWQFSEAYPPGFFADLLEEWLRFTKSAGVAEGESEAGSRVLMNLRPHSSVFQELLRNGAAHEPMAALSH